jgi:DNA-binding transcriptional LysR family regulator
LREDFSPGDDERLNFELLFNEPFVVAAGAQNQWARRRRIELAELCKRILGATASSERYRLDCKEAFRAGGLNYPRATVGTDSPEARLSLLTSGQFITIFPASALQVPARRSDIKVLPVELPTAYCRLKSSP